MSVRNWLAGAALVAFAVWCVVLVVGVAGLRSDLEGHVGWLRSLQEVQRTLGTDGAREAASELARSTREMAREARAASGAQGLVMHLGELSAQLDRMSVRAEAEEAAELATQRCHDAVVAIRAETRRLSVELGSRWTQIYLLALASLLMGALILGQLAVAHRRRAQMERLQGQLRVALENAERARREAERADEAKSRFIAVMSHEIRTPMTAILGAMELLESTTLDARQHELVSMAHSGGQTLLALLNDLLDLSRIEAAQLELEAIDFDLWAVVEDVFSMFGARAESAGLELTFYIAAGTPRWLRGDPTRLRQIIANLLSNALKFTAEGGVSVELAPQPTGPGGVEIRVSDTGIGVPEQVRERIFEAFGQADASTTRQHGGTGLGLSISRRLVRAMGGDLTLESGVGEGSTFKCDLWLDQAETYEAQRAADEALFQQVRGVRATLVGPEAWTAPVARQLRAWGLSVEVAAVLSDAPASSELVAVWDPVQDAALDRFRQGRAESLPGLVWMHTRAPDPAFLPDDRDLTLGRWALPTRLLAVLEHVTRGQVTPRGLRTTPASSLRPFGYALRVLIVDDQESVLHVVSAMLSRLGCEVVTATDGRLAAQLANESELDLILMDLEMPVADGVAATRAIRGTGGINRACPIIAVTAHAATDSWERCRDAGMDDIITKPVQARVLRALVERWTREHGARAGNPRTPA